MLLLIVNIVLLIAALWYARKHLNLSEEDMNVMWCGYFAISFVKDVSGIVVGILTMSSGAIIMALIASLISGLFAYYFAKQANLL